MAKLYIWKSQYDWHGRLDDPKSYDATMNSYELLLKILGWVCNKKNLPLCLMNDLNIIDNLMIKVDFIEVSHIFKETNPLANFSLKNGVSRKYPIYFGYVLIPFFILLSSPYFFSLIIYAKSSQTNGIQCWALWSG